MMQKGTLDLDPTDERLLDELAGIVYENDAKGRLKIESKDDMRKRGVKSPDAADACWYASFDARALLGDSLQPGDRMQVDVQPAIDLLQEIWAGPGQPW